LGVSSSTVAETETSVLPVGFVGVQETLEW
jgi:hypothetical protein